MTEIVNDPEVRTYLATLHGLLEGEPDRELVVDGVRQHIVDELGGQEVDPQRVRVVLDELGDPGAIAADARTSAKPTVVTVAPLPFLDRRAGAVLTVLLLTVGGVVVPVAGWIVGLGLLWFSKGWTVVDKLIATFGPIVLTGAVAGVAYLATGLPGHLAVLVALGVGIVGVAVYLLARFREGGRTHAAQG